MSELLEGLLQASTWLAVALLLLAVMRPLLQRLGGAALVYRSWWLLPLVLLAPLLPAPVLPLADSTPVLVLGAALRAPVVPSNATLWPVLLAASWGAGVILVAALQWRGQQRFERGLGALQPRSDGSWQASADPGLPALVGLWAPRVVVGPDFDTRFSAAERDLILQHEHQHRCHGDHWANAALALLRCLFWFHPLLPWAARRFLYDQELACDARTVDPHPALRRLYANALLKAQLVHPVAPVACHWRSQPMLKERIAMLKEHKPKGLPWLSGQVLVIGLCAGAGTVAWASQDTASAGPSISTEAAAVAAQGMAEGGTTADVKVRNMGPPTYPRHAFEQGVSGKVVLRVNVDTEGRPDDIRVLSSSPTGVFDEVSIAAAKGWTFEPALRDGRPVAAALQIPLTFALDEPEPAP
ncbi:TonB family protein [Stenotrophomonas sp. ISL-67]|uniref:M56 family metallopeptidase n=1 Tax=Stenotrophomonas sp. ISL-67 TaxID=2819171 RepID=UPI001BE657FB|nr:TonB family protein [Stenotrophomonas sp. ISL-67]MBT2766779.1 TonB family protein [Stenotrophomonas sp. ISL-67]